MLTMREELELARKAYARDPESIRLRHQLAYLLVVLDEFDEAIDLMRQWNVQEHRFFDLQAAALLSRETEADDREVKELCRKAVTFGQTPLERANALSLLAKAQIRLSEFDDARVSLMKALDENHRDKDAYKRMVALNMQDKNPEAVLTDADKMINSGVAHSRVIASQSLAMARMGLIEEARESQGLDEFLVQYEPPVPAGWATLEDFNRDLAAEVLEHPGMRFERYGSASARTWRLDEPALRRMKVFPELQKMVQREVVKYAASLPQTGHPFLRGRPPRAELRNWCVITEGDGHETWHVHQNGWLSGVYYIHIQDHIALGTGKEGCIAFGLPEGTIGEENAKAFGEVLCRPRTGLMMIFPSHSFHRTYPHHGSGRRICYAFDIIPKLDQ
jgi:tetratricopeptide (TPR) repeat protein